MGTQYFCKNERRRALVRQAVDGGGNPILNGIDYLEVGADQSTLVLHFIHPLPGEAGGFPAAPLLTRRHFLIEGGVRVQNIRVIDPVSAAGNELTLKVDTVGDFSTYRLRLVDSLASEVPPAGFDRQLAEVEFSFKVDCPSDFDCQLAENCPPEAFSAPPLDYLAKDYGAADGQPGFRRLMLDRLAVVMPDWKERNPADIGVALVETLAYAADQLSYYQDAVATEAYLGTARKRVSLRRHARLLDYAMHDGCNARVWAQLQVNQDNVAVPAGTQLLTAVAGFEPRLDPTSTAYQQALGQEPEVFETLHELRGYAAHNEIQFYTWGDSDCCLPKGATRATLRKSLPFLAPGDVLIFEEARGPQSGLEADADPNHRQAVRLTAVNATEFDDPLFIDPDTALPMRVTEIEWRIEDALAFPLCLSARQGNDLLTGLSVARGNIVLADHGRTFKNETLSPAAVPAEGPSGSRAIYRPLLGGKHRGALTQRVAYRHATARQQPAFQALRQDPGAALPEVKLYDGRDTWLPQRDLLGSDRFAPEFVVEIESSPADPGPYAFVRFGDDLHGRAPAGGTQFRATYRLGNGLQGNIGAEALFHIATTDGRISAVRNPMPAEGGSEAEDREEVRLYAPQAFRTQERAVTAQDYADMAQRHPDIQKAVATLRWTGSWKTVFITVDRKGGRPVSAEFEAELRRYLERYRMAGHDLEIDAPRYVPLDVTLVVCLKAGYTRSAVRLALLDLFSNRLLPGGSKGFFHPDALTFGQTIYLSQLVATAMQAPGVDWVQVTRFQRWGQAAHGELDDGRIRLGRLEIARLDNDANLPENGKIEIVMEGGL